MSGGTACKCIPRDRSGWWVYMYKCNHSAFNGYRLTPSQYSAVTCVNCGAHWRSKAEFTNTLPHSPPEPKPK